MGYIKITAEGLPGIFAEFAYKPTFSIEENRVINEGFVSTTIQSDEDVSLVNDPLKIIRNIQVLMWRKYSLTVYGHEDSQINKFDKVMTLWIDVNDGTNSIVYKAHVLNDLSATRKRIADTFKYEYTIIFLDRNLQNYSGVQPVSNFLESRSIFESDVFGFENDFEGLNYVDFSLGLSAEILIDSDFRNAWNGYYHNQNPILSNVFFNKYRINTVIQPIPITILRKAEERTSGDLNEKLSRQVKYKALRIIAYCNEIDKNIVERYCNFCHDGENKVTLYHSANTNTSQDIVALERVVPIIQKVKDGSEIWKVEFIILIEKIDYLPYA